MTRRILSIGWIGHGDFGDEVMGRVLRARIGRDGLGPVTYYMRGTQPLFQGKDERRPRALYVGDMPGRLQGFLDPLRLRPFDTVLVGGGSVLHSANSIAWKLQLIRRVRRAHPRAAFAASVGVSVGPLAGAAEERLCAEYLAANDLVVVRDAESARVAARLCPSASVIASLDTALALPEADREAWRAAVSGPRDPDTVGVIFVRKDDGRPVRADDDDIRRRQAIVDGLLKEGKRVRLITLYSGRHYRDREMNGLLADAASRSDRVERHVFDGDIYRTVAALHGCGSLLSSRLHGVIFAYLLGVPFVSVGYHRKNADFCASVGYPDRLALDDAAGPEAVLDAMRRAGEPFTDAEPLDHATSRVRDGLDALVRKMTVSL